MIKHCNGFTLIELISIIIIIGVLAAYAAPLLNLDSYNANGCAETLQASLRFAQKLAIAQRSTPATITVTDSCQVSVAGNSYPALSGVSVTNAGSVAFNDQGQPFLNGTLMTSILTFTVSGGTVTHYICLEAQTGYVHNEAASCG